MKRYIPVYKKKTEKRMRGRKTFKTYEGNIITATSVVDAIDQVRVQLIHNPDLEFVMFKPK